MRTALLSTLLASMPLTALAEGGTLVLEVAGFQSTEGTVLVAVYDLAHADLFPGDATAAVLKTAVAPTLPTTVVTFDDVPPGTYAAVVVHDVNGNGVLDVRRIIPIPKEPIGASRDAKGSFGPPRFADAQFEVGVGRTVERFSVASL